jgi:hypothetical protein
MHDHERSTIEELSTKLLVFSREPTTVTFSLHIVKDEAGDWSSSLQFERDDAVAGGGVVYGKTLVELLKNVVAVLPSEANGA